MRDAAIFEFESNRLSYSFTVYFVERFYRTTALSLRTLRSQGISHILNGASGCASCLMKQNCGGCVLTKSSFYDSEGITFAGIQANDERRFPIFRYFHESSEFIDKALESGGKEFAVSFLCSLYVSDLLKTEKSNSIFFFSAALLSVFKNCSISPYSNDCGVIFK